MSAMIKKILRIAALLVMVVASPFVVFALAAALLNAYDPPLSPEARKLIEAVKPLAPDPAGVETYVLLLGVNAPADADPAAHGRSILAALQEQDKPGFTLSTEWANRIDVTPGKRDPKRPRCIPGTTSCLETAAKRADLRAFLEANARAIERYRALRARPAFAEAYRASFEGSAPDTGGLVFELQSLALLSASQKANAGDLGAALAEIEAGNRFHRRVLAGAQTPSTLAVAQIALRRDAFFVSELMSAHGAALAAHRGRLAAIVSPLDGLETDVRRVLSAEEGNFTRWLSELRINEFARMVGDPVRWWNPFLHRPRETANIFAAQVFLGHELLAVSPEGLRARSEEVGRQQRALIRDGWTGWLINPVGNRLLEESRMEDVLDSTVWYTRARAIDTEATLALVSLQIALHKAGARTPEAIGAALAGPIGAAHPDPWTAKPMTYDAKTSSVGFSPGQVRGFPQKLTSRFNGRVAVKF